MGRVRYNRKTKQYERDILINDIPAKVNFPKRKHLEELPYRLYSKTRTKSNKKINSKTN